PDFSLENFAATFNVSTTFLTKFIKQETGLSFAKMTAELKLDYIKSELVETERPIKQIIYDAGYYDVSNFTRKFRKLIGLTPGDYRKHHKENGYAEKNPAI
ncbi:MAG: AraC family transcriptional regulator, partial [Lactococcus raffinolactis]